MLQHFQRYFFRLRTMRASCGPELDSAIFLALSVKALDTFVSKQTNLRDIKNLTAFVSILSNSRNFGKMCASEKSITCRITIFKLKLTQMDFHFLLTVFMETTNTDSKLQRRGLLSQRIHTGAIMKRPKKFSWQNNVCSAF